MTETWNEFKDICKFWSLYTTCVIAKFQVNERYFSESKGRENWEHTLREFFNYPVTFMHANNTQTQRNTQISEKTCYHIVTRNNSAILCVFKERWYTWHSSRAHRKACPNVVGALVLSCTERRAASHSPGSDFLLHFFSVVAMETSLALTLSGQTLWVLQSTDPFNACTWDAQRRHHLCLGTAL